MKEPIDTNALPPDDVQAAEYVLGTLPASERAAVARRVRDDRNFARLIEKWERHFEPLAEDFEPVAPPPRVKAALDSALFPTAERRHAAQKSGVLQSLLFWRAMTVGALACAVAALVVPRYAEQAPVEITVQQPEPAPRFVASLRHDDTDVHYFAIYNAQEKRVGLNHVSGARPDGHDFVLWISHNQQPAVELGVVPVGGTVSISAEVAASLSIDAGTVFMITLEPHQRTAPDAPSGPVVATGDLRRI